MAITINSETRVVVLVGGVGGAKLAHGLAQLIPDAHLTVIVNVADDFIHHGLKICPDSDTIMYTLAGIVDPVNGWGIAGDTTAMLDMLRTYGGETWFRLGDRDMATHLLRTNLLKNGMMLTEVTRRLAFSLGIRQTILPVTNDPVATMVDTVEYGELDFQTYFVRHRWQPTVKAIRYSGIEAARLTADVVEAIRQADIILFGPSNPWLSLEPILAVGHMRQLLASRPVPRVAVTPIIGGQAVKGPAAKIMRELDYKVSAETVARFYGAAINGFVNDIRNDSFERDSLRTVSLDTMMHNEQDRRELAQNIFHWIAEWSE